MLLFIKLVQLIAMPSSYNEVKFNILYVIVYEGFEKVYYNAFYDSQLQSQCLFRDSC